MIKGISSLEVKNFVSKEDKGAEKTIWKISALSNRVKSHVTALCSDTQSFDGILAAVSFGLKGFENFKKQDGSEIQFLTKDRNINGKIYPVVDESIIELIPFPILLEIGAEILNCSKMSEEEEKNS